jgi:hypothetical protein
MQFNSKTPEMLTADSYLPLQTRSNFFHNQRHLMSKKGSLLPSSVRLVLQFHTAATMMLE